MAKHFITRKTLLGLVLKG